MQRSSRQLEVAYALVGGRTSSCRRHGRPGNHRNHLGVTTSHDLCMECGPRSRYGSSLSRIADALSDKALLGMFGTRDTGVTGGVGTNVTAIREVGPHVSFLLRYLTRHTACMPDAMRANGRVCDEQVLSPLGNFREKMSLLYRTHASPPQSSPTLEARCIYTVCDGRDTRRV